jgi:hypothetical protein
MSQGNDPDGEAERGSEGRQPVDADGGRIGRAAAARSRRLAAMGALLSEWDSEEDAAAYDGL